MAGYWTSDEAARQRMRAQEGGLLGAGALLGQQQAAGAGLASQPGQIQQIAPFISVRQGFLPDAGPVRAYKDGIRGELQSEVDEWLKDIP